MLCIQGMAAVQVPAAQLLRSFKKTQLMLEGARGLSAACAMELHAVLVTAAHKQTTATMQTTLQEIQESTSTMRTLGALLVPRLGGESIERDLASAMAVQGESVAELAEELETALVPLVPAADVRLVFTRVASFVHLLQLRTSACGQWPNASVKSVST